MAMTHCHYRSGCLAGVWDNEVYVYVCVCLGVCVCVCVCGRMCHIDENLPSNVRLFKCLCFVTSVRSTKTVSVGKLN